MVRPSMLALVAVMIALATPAQAAPPPESWAGQLEGLSQWLDAHKRPAPCTERCFVLSKMKLTGTLADLRFELEGGVLADGPVAVPLFGPPGKVRLDEVTEDGKPAAVGFESDRYYLFTGAKRFVIKGKVSIESDAALQIVGPLNVLESDLKEGRVVEGPRLSGLAGTTIHFDVATKEAPAQEPTVFQLSRAVRVGREVGFEYKLVMRSGSDLGVVRLPLRYGEKVLEVTGASGWRVEGEELVLSTAGRTATMDITGTLPKMGSFEVDARSPYEWWLLETDAEHRVIVQGDAKQLDSAESPIARTQPSARLFMLKRGQKLDVTVQTLTSAEVLAAIVRSHTRMVVITIGGDVISDDSIQYENNGIDYLLYSPSGHPIFLATDGKSERVMRGSGEEMMIPLRTGSHLVRTQSIGRAAIGTFGGKLRVEAPRFPLTASNATVTVGLPGGVRPLAVMGGERTQWFLGVGDLVAVLAAIGVAIAAFRTRAARVLGALVLAGLWALSPVLYSVGIAAGLTVFAGWLLHRLYQGPYLKGLVAAAGGVIAIFMLFVMAASVRKSAPITSTAAPAATSPGWYADGERVDDAKQGEESKREAPKPVDLSPLEDNQKDRAKLGNFRGQNAQGGIVQGVTPVALSLPGYARTISISRELVTKDRPVDVTLYYVTDTALLPLLGAWLLALALLVREHRHGIARLWTRVRERLAAPPAPQPAE